MDFFRKRLLAGAVIGGLALALVAMGVLLIATGEQSARAIAPQAIVGIDTDTTGNTATSLDELDTCLSVANQSGDQFDIDVFLDGIPTGKDLSGFNYNINWDDTRFKIISQDHLFLLNEDPDSTVLDVFSEAVPDTASPHFAGPTDLIAAGAEVGPMRGVLGRYTLEVLPGAATGLSEISLSGVGVFDSGGEDIQDMILGPVTIGLSTSCPQPVDVEISEVGVSADGEADTGQPFGVRVSATAYNNGPADPVDTEVTLTLNLPADCTAEGGNQQIVPVDELPKQWPTGVTGDFSVTCTDPSFHDFTGAASIAVTQDGIEDSNPANDSAGPSPTSTTAVWTETDVEVTFTSADVPDSATVGEAFDVTGSATVRNNGPFGPVDANVDVYIVLPDDCSTGPSPQSIAVTGLASSESRVVDATWSVTCEKKSSHDFRADANIELDQLHVRDTDPDNDYAEGQEPATVPVFAEADLEKTLEVFVWDETDEECSLPVPDEIPVGEDVELCLLSTIHNNGPADTLFDDTVDLVSAPDDCDVWAGKGEESEFPIGSVGTFVAAGEDYVFEDFITINCSQPSFHTFEFENTVGISVEEKHVVDPDDTNNSDTATATIGVTAEADLKVLDVIVDAPDSVNAGEAFDVTVDAEVHNNGPFGPFDATATVTFDADDCTVNGDSDATFDVTDLEVSVASSIPQQTFSVTCSSGGEKTFSATVDAAAVHIDDGSGDGSDTTTVVTPTPTPTPTPVVAAATATPAPTPTPTPIVLGVTQLPDTGGTPAQGSGAASWIFVALGGGLLAIVAGGGLTAARLARRRVR